MEKPPPVVITPFALDWHAISENDVVIGIDAPFGGCVPPTETTYGDVAGNEGKYPFPAHPGPFHSDAPLPLFTVHWHVGCPVLLPEYTLAAPLSPDDATMVVPMRLSLAACVFQCDLRRRRCRVGRSRCDKAFTEV